MLQIRINLVTFCRQYVLPMYCLFTAYLLPIYCLFTAYLLPIYCLFTAYSLPIHCLFTAYSLPVYCLFTTCLLPIHCLSTPMFILPLPIHCLFTAYFLPISCLFTADSLPIHCLFTAYSLPIHCLFTACLLPIYCLFTAYPMFILPLLIHCLFPAYFLPFYLPIYLPIYCLFTAYFLPISCCEMGSHKSEFVVSLVHTPLQLSHPSYLPGRPWELGSIIHWSLRVAGEGWDSPLHAGAIDPLWLPLHGATQRHNLWSTWCMVEWLCACRRPHQTIKRNTDLEMNKHQINVPWRLNRARTERDETLSQKDMCSTWC
jgi:hypothetical protein